MVALSKYEDSAVAFLGTFPIGTVVGPGEVIDWATDHGNGLATDLLIPDPGKRVSALRRHLNNGGSSYNLSEDQRFYLAVEDTKRKTMLVQSLADRTNEQAHNAVGKSMRGAMTPIKRSQKAIEDHKLEELPEEKRLQLEEQLRDLVEIHEPLKKLFSQQLINSHVKILTAKGYSPQQARDLLELMPTFSQYAKLQRVIS
jgi:hypothetical protein